MISGIPTGILRHSALLPSLGSSQWSAQKREGLRLDPGLAEGALIGGGIQLWAYPGLFSVAYIRNFVVPNGNRRQVTNVIKQLPSLFYKK